MVGLESLAFPLLPAEGGSRAVVVVAAGERWRLADRRLASDVDVLLWGRAPLSSAGSTLAVLRAALSREMTLRRGGPRAPAGMRRTAAYRLPPPARTTGIVRTALRSAVTSGALVEFRRPGAGPRVLDAVMQAAGGSAGLAGFRPGSGGAAIARTALRDGTPVLLRLAPVGSPGDPEPGTAALSRLHAARVRAVPLPRGRGVTAGASWSAETLLQGRRPRRLTRGLALQVVRFCAQLPSTDTAPTALGLDLRRIAAVLPDRAGRLLRLAADVEPDLRRTHAVLRHGDLWAGNLLVTGVRLVGVVDWDAWHPAAVPGADVLQLLATALRHRTGRELGAVWLERPWRRDDYARLAREYARALGAAPRDLLEQVVGVAWWAGEVAGTLGRHPERAVDERWLAVNVDPVLAALDAGG